MAIVILVCVHDDRMILSFFLSELHRAKRIVKLKMSLFNLLLWLRFIDVVVSVAVHSTRYVTCTNSVKVVLCS